MKNVLMKMNFAVLLIAATASFAMADYTPPGVNAWPNAHDKIVAVSANPTLKVDLNEIDVDDDNFAVLQVSLNYVAQDITQQINEILKRYPTYSVQRVILQTNGAYHYSINALGISNNVDPKPGMDGPYIEDTLYLTKSQTMTVRSEIAKGNPVVQVTGSVIGTVPLMKVLEHKEFDPSICSQLLGDSQTIGNLIFRLANLQSVVRTEFRYDSTRESLVSDIQANCFEVAKPSQVASFTDLLNLSVTAKSPNRPLVGETTQKTLVQTEIPLSYATVQTDSKPRQDGGR